MNKNLKKWWASLSVRLVAGWTKAFGLFFRGGSA